MHTFTTNGTTATVGDQAAAIAHIALRGSFGGGTITAEVIDPALPEATAGNWIPVPGVAATSATLVAIAVPGSWKWRLRLAGATSPTIEVTRINYSSVDASWLSGIGEVLRPTAIGGSGSGAVSVSNFPATQAVAGTRANDGSVAASGQGHLTVGGSDGTNLRPALVDAGGRTIVKPVLTSGGHLTVTTAATGANWTALGAQACTQLTLVNDTGTKIELRQGGSGAGFRVLDGGTITLFGITNANQIEARRVDTSNTQVTLTARWEA